MLQRAALITQAQKIIVHAGHEKAVSEGQGLSGIDLVAPRLHSARRYPGVHTAAVRLSKRVIGDLELDQGLSVFCLF